MKVVPILGVAVAFAAGLVAIVPLCRSDRAADEGASASSETLASRVGSSADRGQAVRWVVAAGGSLPELNQVQIEQDVGLVAEVFGVLGRGQILFGAGADSPSVQVLAPASERDGVLAALGDLFAPRGGRDARYRATTLEVDEAATAATVTHALERSVSERGAPLFVVLAGHGNRGETARDNTLDLWAQSSLTVAEVATILDRSEREVRVVATTCFSGGFAELAFEGADPARGPARKIRCGLFATVWDLEAAGCDPNPDRAAQEGYALHFFNALRGRDRDGKTLDRATLALDRDGRISLLEAHTRVRLVSEAADVPTTTSERWLREVAPEMGPSLAAALPEEDALIAALLDRLGLRGEEATAFVRLEQLEARIEAMTQALDQDQEREDAAYRAAAASLLARWPVLDDPWHPDFVATLERERPAIAEHLETDPTLATYRSARTDVDRRQHQVAELRRESAWVERLTRALDNRTLAGRLHAVGGPPWETYERLLACERATLE
jgi:hypothetical protein